METIEPPESTSGTPVVEPPDAGAAASEVSPGGGDEPDEPEAAELAAPADADDDIEVLDTEPELEPAEPEVAPPVVAVVVTPRTRRWVGPAPPPLAPPGYPAPPGLGADHPAGEESPPRLPGPAPTADGRAPPQR